MKEQKPKKQVSPKSKWMNRALNVALIVVLGLVIYYRGPLLIAYFDSSKYQDEENIAGSGEIVIENQESVQDDLADLEGNVSLVHYRLMSECPVCDKTESLYRMIAQMNDKITFEPKLLADSNPSLMSLQEVDKAPALIIMRERDNHRNVRFMGLPAGFEFGTIITGILYAGQSKPLLSEEIQTKLSTLINPVKIEVLVTRGCMFCAPQAKMVMQFGFSSDKIIVDIIEIENFPGVAQQYNVDGFPSTIINGGMIYTGMMDEDDMIEALLE